MSQQRYQIALDAMSGDQGAESVVSAAVIALEEFDDIELILVGDESTLQKICQEKNQADNPRLKIQHASEVVAMDESPATALRGKKDSSMRVSINLVKSGNAHACVSAGNTGALMATARFVLKTLPGIDRPAICTAVPSLFGHTHLLDLGANIDSTSEHLHQFAVMGAALVEAVDGSNSPRIGLLNVGEEEMKGNQQVKEAAKLLADSKLNYIGFVEGDDIYTSDVDVVVCDGFIGNVALKSSEGLAKMISTYLKAEFLKNPLTKFMGILSMPVLKAFRKRIDPRHYNGASLLGLQGITVKSHGGADALSFANAIKIARLAAEQNIPRRIESLLAEMFAK